MIVFYKILQEMKKAKENEETAESSTEECEDKRMMIGSWAGEERSNDYKCGEGKQRKKN